MDRRLLFALLALPAVVSCVPEPTPGRARVVMDIPPPRTSQALLKQLDLIVPKDLPLVVLPDRASADADAFATPPPADPFLSRVQSPDDAMRAIDCLTQAVYYEAASEPTDGQRAVAQVVLNRVRDRAFPASVCGVVYQGSTRRTGCQFSFTCDGSLARRPQPAAWDRARSVATAALAGDVYAPIGAATFYHADYVSPWWAPSLSQVGQIGRHIFYRWKSAMERALAYRQDYSGVEPDTSWSPPAVGPVPAVIAGAPDLEHGVAIHRSGRDPAATTPAVASATPAAAKSALRPSMRFVSGVRVHSGQQELPDEAPYGENRAGELGITIHQGDRET